MEALAREINADRASDAQCQAMAMTIRGRRQQIDNQNRASAKTHHAEQSLRNNNSIEPPVYCDRNGSSSAARRASQAARLPRECDHLEGATMKIDLARGRALYAAVGLALAVALAGCGGGGSADVVVVADGSSVPRLDIALRRAGPVAIQVAWSDDPDVESFLVARNGMTLVDSVNATSVVDSSVVFNVEYCYQVFGYDFAGHLISATEEACIVV
jgi:hypothetical protein